MNEVAYFEIQAENVDRAKNFYQQLFEWTFHKAAELEVEYWRIEAGGVRGGLLKRPAKTPPLEYGTNAFVCSIMVENFDEVAAKIENLGGKVALPKFAVPGVCWQGYFIDTEGNTFGLFQADKDAR